EGFRKFMIKEETPVKVIEVDDFVDVEPFKSLGASNKTATIIMQKGFKTEYPVPYIKWYKMAPGVIDGDDLLESVMSKIEFEPEIAVPLRDDVDKKFQNSPWLIAPENEMQALKGLVGKSQFRARK